MSGTEDARTHDASQPPQGGPGFDRVGPVLYKAACPDCRARLELHAHALRLAIGATRKTTFYSFTCPECGAAVRKPAGERIVELLTKGGVRTLRLHTPRRS
ncbi:CpXC domain-containing protein [Streptomyces sulfonofaciens]|nr:CpXC domain-containing protein [Streptomyces sulfonofaciens]